VDAVPALAALRTSVRDVHARAERWSRSLAGQGVSCAVVDVAAVAGGGAFAEESFPSAGIALEGDAEVLLSRLRRGEPPVVARIGGDRVILDARTVLPDEDDALLRAIVAACRPQPA
jgi:L-seryl-tRNA(Ser) seleniumtransferase